MDDIVRAQIYNMMEMSIALTKQLQDDSILKALAKAFIDSSHNEHKLIFEFYKDMKKGNPKIMENISVYEFVCYIQIMNVMGMIVSDGVLVYEKNIKKMFDEDVFSFKK